MEIKFNRLWPNDECVTGVVDIDGSQLCFFLEDRVREIPGLDVAEWKIKGETAIPRGRYQLVLDYSQRFQKITPHLLDVPGFTGIRVHGGNRASDTEGCIIIGEKRYDAYTVGECAIAMSEFIMQIDLALANNETCWATIA